MPVMTASLPPNWNVVKVRVMSSNSIVSGRMRYLNPRQTLTELSSPMVNSIKKNITEKKVDPGIAAIASGYTMNTSPGPSVAT